MIPFFDSTGMIYMHWVPTGQTVNKEYYFEFLREFSKRFLGKRPALFKSAQWHFNRTMYQSTRWASRQFLTVPYSRDLAPCDFWLFPKLRACRYETIEEMKVAVTKVIDTLTQEDFHGAFQKVFERYNKCIEAGGDYFEGDYSFPGYYAIDNCYFISEVEGTGVVISGVFKYLGTSLIRKSYYPIPARYHKRVEIEGHYFEGD